MVFTYVILISYFCNKLIHRFTAINVYQLDQNSEFQLQQ